MRWLERIRQRPEPQVAQREPDQPGPAPVERRSPGLAALFDTASDDGRHSVLDLGPASAAHLRVLGRFARRIRFAGLLPRPPDAAAWGSAVAAIEANPSHPYDLVLAWDILDRIDPEARPLLIERLAAVTTPHARLYALVDTSGRPTRRPTRSTLLGADRVTEVPEGPPGPAGPPILPGPLEQLLRPFEVTHAFSLRTGEREYVARKGTGRPGGPRAAYERRD